jgi:hypothetical protein
MIEENDTREGYCRMLGHRLKFRYCRSVNERLPCSRIMDCWFEAFPVREFIQRNYNEGEVGRFLAPAQPKIVSILELAERARRRIDEE